MPSVAEVQFKASGQQQVVGAFKSVGDSAATATTKVQQNSGAMKSMGQGMKSSLSGIAQVGTAFATLSLSIVGTWRAYRDLTDAQLAVDRANLKVQKTNEAIRKTTAAIAAIKKQEAKGGLENQRQTMDVALAMKAAGEAAKKYGKNSIEAKDAQLKVNEAQAKGLGHSQKLTDAENKLAILQDQLGISTTNAKEAQERFNDTQQNFYLSLLPTALSGIASLSLAFGGLKGVLGGGAGGIVGMLGPIGIGLGAISLAVIAFQTNFLGLRDKIGGVITWFKDRFGAWKDTIQEVFGFIQKGDWQGAFNRIKQAAQAFWQDLKTSVPFFGTIENIVNKIKNGNWKGAFLEIVVAAKAAWETLKKAVPFFAGVEIFINDLKKGDWAGAWAVVAKGAQDALSGIFGKDVVTNFITQIQQIPEKLKAAMNAPGATAWSVIDAILPTPVKDFAAQVNAWTKEFGTLVLNALKSGITFVAHTWIDPFLKSLFDIATWQAALTAITPGTVGIMKMILDVMFPIPGGKADPNSAKYLEIATGIFKSIGTSVHTASAIYLPEYTQANDNLINNLKTAIINGAKGWQALGTDIWNAILEGLKKIIPFASVGLDAFKVKPTLEPPDQSAISQWTSNVNTQLATKPPTAKATLDLVNFTKQYNEAAAKLKAIGNMKPAPAVTIKVNGTDKVLKAVDAIHKVQGKTVVVTTIMRTINQVLGTAGRFANQGAHPGRGSLKHMATGGQGTVTKPTLFLAGEGGRKEDYSFKPHGSSGGSGSGGGDIYIGPIYLGDEKIQDRMRYKINKFQGVMK